MDNCTRKLNKNWIQYSNLIKHRRRHKIRKSRIISCNSEGIIIIASSSRIPEFLIRCNHDVCILPARIQSPRTMHSVVRRLHTHEHSPISISLSAQHLIPKRFPRATCKFPPIPTFHTIRVARFTFAFLLWTFATRVIRVPVPRASALKAYERRKIM